MRDWPLVLHINYFEPDISWLEMCRITRELGADGIEFRQRPFHWKQTDAEYLDVLSAALAAHPLEFVSFGWPGPNLMLPDASAREAEVARCVAFYNEAARRFGTPVFNTFTGDLSNIDPTVHAYESAQHGSGVAQPEHWEWAADGFRVLAREAESNGYALAFETHGHYLHDSLAASVRLVDAIGSSHVGVLWDHANFLLYEDVPGPDKVISDLGQRLLSVHLKNWLLPPRFHASICALDEGIINVREQLTLLRDSGWRGPVCVESPRRGDRLAFLQRDYTYLDRTMRELGMR